MKNSESEDYFSMLEYCYGIDDAARFFIQGTALDSCSLYAGEWEYGDWDCAGATEYHDFIGAVSNRVVVDGILECAGCLDA